MASHRKPRSPRIRTSPALGITTAALTSVALMSQSAQAAPAPREPKPSLEDVQKKVDDLYRQAGTATQNYNAAKERTAGQREHVDELLDDVAQRTDKLNDARRELGSFAAAQYRSGGISDTATLFLADDAQGYFDQSQLMDRLTERQKRSVEDYEKQQAKATKKRSEAAKSLEKLTESQQSLKSSKKDVQSKLSEARTLLSKLTAQEKARLAEIERKKEAEAKRKAAALAKKQAAAEAERKAEEATREKEEAENGTGSGSGSGTGSGSDSGGSSDTSYAAKAQKVIAFAEAQMGKPYVWGAAGPDSFDCSGLTQGAWKAAGISLPRTTWDQVEVGQRVSVDNAKPGDLVFFYDDISHVGIYIGNGEMIHAPKPGANVRVESIYYMPIYGVVRPA